MSTDVQDGTDALVPLGRTAEGRPVPPVRRRARGRLDLEDPVVGWSAALGLTMLAFLLRLWHLGSPKAFEFDETYYAKDAWSLINNGYVRGYVDNRSEEHTSELQSH